MGLKKKIKICFLLFSLFVSFFVTFCEKKLKVCAMPSSDNELIELCNKIVRCPTILDKFKSNKLIVIFKAGSYAPNKKIDIKEFNGFVIKVKGDSDYVSKECVGVLDINDLTYIDDASLIKNREKFIKIVSITLY